MPPPLYLTLPPEDVSLWTDEDTNIFEEWSKWVAKGSKKKFRIILDPNEQRAQSII